MSHTSEKSWPDVSDVVARRTGKLSEMLIVGEALYNELLEIWQYHGASSQSVADQLFAYKNNGSNATPEQVAMVDDMKAAMLAVHNLYVGADWSAIRRMSAELNRGG